ncbi:MAG TPA: hypothetical protein VGI39_16515 [Polyangiaceae bacterium]|jgi:RNA polymerase sigma-70 factor (ECF subfamily)
MVERPEGAETLERVLAGDARARRAFVDLLAPVVQARVARALLRSNTGRRQGRDLRQHVEDFTQDVFASLFADDARALRAWDPGRGMSLKNFVGLIAEHQVASTLRSGRQNPWKEEPMLDTALTERVGAHDGLEGALGSRELLDKLLDRLRAELTPRGLHLFQLLVVEERPVEDVCAATEMRPDAVYAWRSRLGKLVRRIASEITDSASETRARARIPPEEGERAR